LALSVVLAETPPGGDSEPQLRLRDPGRQMMADARGFSLNVEVSNAGTHVLKYVGYRSDSFSPPIEEGRMAPMYRLEVRQAGKWKVCPIGWCGTGIDDIEIAPKTSATFAVWVKAGPWDAV
jgi:hypothetical protein